MAKEKTRLWVVLILVLVMLLFLAVGSWSLYNDMENIWGFLFFGLGIGGFIAAWGAWQEGKGNK